MPSRSMALDNTPDENQLVIGGVLNFNGTSLSTTNSVFDYNDGGFVLQAQSFASGSITAPDSFGRVTINLVPKHFFGAELYVIGLSRRR